MNTEEVYYIYKITNIKNNKIYIGQSTNPNKRFKNHMNKNYNGGTSHTINNDVNKYGDDSFVLSVIDECENKEEADKKEDYWIEYYKNNGYEMYNIKKGGITPPKYYGEEHPACNYSDNQVFEVIYLLKNTHMTYLEIAEKINVSYDFVSKINNGITRKISEIEYPIRKENEFDIIADKIIYDLKNTNLSHRKIAEKYGVSKSTVTMINTGNNRHNNSINYPIRKKN